MARRCPRFIRPLRRGSCGASGSSNVVKVTVGTLRDREFTSSTRAVSGTDLAMRLLPALSEASAVEWPCACWDLRA